MTKSDNSLDVENQEISAKFAKIFKEVTEETGSTFTDKQKLFVIHFANNRSEAARLAGYKEDMARQVGSMNMTKPHIILAIHKRDVTLINTFVYNREQRQAFWANMMTSAEKAKDRLQASKLLGRSEADFTDNINNKMSGSIRALSNQDIEAELKDLKEKKKVVKTTITEEITWL